MCLICLCGFLCIEIFSELSVLVEGMDLDAKELFILLFHVEQDCLSSEEN